MMKKIFILIFLIILSCSLKAQWVTSGSNIYYSAGKVGIGLIPSSLDSSLQVTSINILQGLKVRWDAKINGVSIGIGKGGPENTLVGQNALFSNISGNHNTALGSAALYLHRKGNQNVSIGSGSMVGDTSGIDNCAIGYYSLSLSKNGNKNVAIGSYSSAYALGSGNTTIGHRALRYYTGSYNIGIGYLAGKSSLDTSSYRMFIGEGDSTNTYLYWNKIKNWGRWNGTLLIKTIPTAASPPTYALATETDGVVRKYTWPTGGGDSTWTDNGYTNKKQTSKRDTVYSQWFFPTEGIKFDTAGKCRMGKNGDAWYITTDGLSGNQIVIGDTSNPAVDIQAVSSNGSVSEIIISVKPKPVISLTVQGVNASSERGIAIDTTHIYTNGYPTNFGSSGVPLDTAFFNNAQLQNLSGSGSVLGVDGSGNVIKVTSKYQVELSNDGDNNLAIPFTLSTDATIIYNSTPLQSTQWSGGGTGILAVAVVTKKYDKITIIN